MTIINVNSISGINSITAQGASGIEFYDSSGNLSGDITLGVGATIKGSSNKITFDTGVPIPVQVDGNGHVGIGTDNNTSAALDVHGDIRISRGSRGDGTGKIFFGSDSGDYLQLQDIGTGGNIFELIQDGSKKVVVRGTNGHLGIGTVTANNMLHIEGSSPSIRMKMTDGPRHMLSPYGADLYLSADNDGTSADTNLIFEVDGGECARFDSNRNLKFPNGKGIDFSASAGSGISANGGILDDYEEGTWTPTYSGAITIVGGYTYQTGYYTKIGDMVHVYGRCTVPASHITGSSSATLAIQGFPYAFKNAGGHYPTGRGYGELPNNAQHSFVIGFPNETNAYFYKDTGDSYSAISGNSVGTSNQIDFLFSITYRT